MYANNELYAFDVQEKKAQEILSTTGYVQIIGLLSHPA
jgi:hypothetical protein